MAKINLENSTELAHLHSTQTSQLNGLFHTFTDFVNRNGLRMNTDWLVNSEFSPHDPKFDRVLNKFRARRRVTLNFTLWIS